MSSTELVDRKWGHRVRRLRASVVEGPDTGTVKPVEAVEQLSIGAAPDNDLVLTDPTVSRYHVELARWSGGISVRDLGSSNGTIVRELRLLHALVPPGSDIRIGRTVVRVDDAGTVEVETAIPELPGLVARSDGMREVVRQIQQLAPAELSVLIEGETGTGKELVARALHDCSERRAAPFVVVDCGSLPPTLIASELFGHERGSFTGADDRRIGAFESADGGTLFLDEIGELPLSLQPALLGALERRRFRRVGSTAELEVNVRVLAATHRDLRAEVNRGGFRSDLYFRLAAARIRIPPLRDRVDDVEPLISHFVEAITGAPRVDDFPADAIAALCAQPWSGNVRELRNVVESALALGRVDLADPALALPASSSVEPYRDARRRALDEFEGGYLRALLEETEGNVSEAARRARMDRAYLLNLLRRNRMR